MTEALDEVLIFNKIKKYENKKVNLSTWTRKQIFPASVTDGSETATLIKNPKHKKGKLTELHLKLNYISNEDYKTYQTYYRLAFYAIKDNGYPGEILYYENIIIKPDINTRNHKLNLEDKTIPYTEKGIFIGIETVKPNSVKLETSMYLTTPNILYTHSKQNLEYSRYRSNNWNKKTRKSVFKKNCTLFLLLRSK